MKADILGNGPSLCLYEPKGGFVVGCNFHENLCDVHVILDKKPFLVFKGKKHLLTSNKLITSEYAMPIIKHHKLDVCFDIIHVIDQLELFQSAGHVATDWCLNNGFTEIHLWGFDSIWKDTQETKTDAFVERDRQQHDLYVHWRERWKQYTNYDIVVHNTKEGTTLKELLWHT